MIPRQLPDDGPIDGPWLDIALEADHFTAVAGHRPQYRRNDRGVVELRGRILGGPASGGQICWFIPAGYRPRGTGSHYIRWVAGVDPSNSLIVVIATGAVNAGFDGGAVLAHDQTIILDGTTWAVAA